MIISVSMTQTKARQKVEIAQRQIGEMALKRLVYMIPLSRDEVRIILMYLNKSRLTIQQNITIFLEYRLYYTWKPKDVKVATVNLRDINYEIFQPTFQFFYGCEPSINVDNLFQYIKMVQPLISSWLSGIIYTGPKLCKEPGHF